MPQEPATIVAQVPRSTPNDRRRPQAALCLSGGGYRAMVFHVGALRRLNESGYLQAIARYSSVSGGSITSAVLGSMWRDLDFDDAGVARRFEAFERRIFDFAGVAVDTGSVTRGILRPRRSISDYVTAKYREHLFGDLTLQDLPDKPRFVITATNLQTGNLFRMSKPYAADYRIGMYHNPTIRLADAVAASSAFPPVLSPKVLEIPTGSFEKKGNEDLHKEPYTTRLILGDGGIYDNLGLQPAESFHTQLVSDGGGAWKTLPKVKSDWLTQTKRAWLTTDRQVRALRRRDLINEYQNDLRNGAFWAIGTAIGHYGVEHLPCTPDGIDKLAKVGTRLKPFPVVLRYRLINWGYLVCDAALRAYVDQDLPIPDELPYPRHPIT